MKSGRVKTLGFTLPDPLAVQVLNAPHSLNIADFAKIPLGRGKIGMSEDDLADKLNGNA